MRTLILLLVLLCSMASSLACRQQTVDNTRTPSTETAHNDRAGSRPGMVFIQGGKFAMGSDEGMGDETPIHNVTLKSFWMDAAEVSVVEFRRFVEATNYQTEADKFGWSGVFDLETGRWEKVAGANWQHPEGPRSTAKDNEPVCQVSWNDALAYARWAGKRLPSEAEWEYAARGGLKAKPYPWGDELRPDGKVLANWWQGTFPHRNTGEDGYVGRAAVGKFPPNGYGLYDMVGNVWEWCADWYQDDFYRLSPASNPVGPPEGLERVIRGGSWMCSENFCSNYRVAARSQATPDSGLNNLGFRCVSDP